MTRDSWVTIMMPAYNAALYIGEAIESVISQSYQNWELIVVDDGSTDETVTIVEGFLDPRIKLIRQPNGGESVARNAALQAMQGEYLAFLDADDKFMSNHLELSLSVLRNHTDLDAVYTDGYYINSDGIQMGSLSSQRRGPFHGWIFDALVRASDVFGPPICVVLRTEHIIKNSLRFDPRIVIGPDWDFLTRFSERANFGYVDDQTVQYRIHDTNITVRTNRGKRAESLAICREKAIRSPEFQRCSIETRAYAFYDLLINLLAGETRRRRSWIETPEFVALPRQERARLLRLSAREAILEGSDQAEIVAWLQKSRELSPGDYKGLALYILYHLSPGLCAWIVTKKRSAGGKQKKSTPFGELL